MIYFYSSIPLYSPLDCDDELNTFSVVNKINTKFQQQQQMYR